MVYEVPSIFNVPILLKNKQAVFNKQGTRFAFSSIHPNGMHSCLQTFAVKNLKGRPWKVIDKINSNLDFSWDGTHIAGATKKELEIFRLSDLATTKSIKIPNIRALRFLRDNNTLVLSRPTDISLYNTSTGTTTKVCTTPFLCENLSYDDAQQRFLAHRYDEGKQQSDFLSVALPTATDQINPLADRLKNKQLQDFRNNMKDPI